MILKRILIVQVVLLIQMDANDGKFIHTHLFHRRESLPVAQDFIHIIVIDLDMEWKKEFQP